MKNILYCLLALIMFDNTAYSQVVSEGNYQTMMIAFTISVNATLAKECPQDVSLEQFKRNIITGISSLSPTAKSNLISYAAPLKVYAQQQLVNDPAKGLTAINDAQLYFLSSFSPSTLIAGGKLTGSSSTPGLNSLKMWSCALDSFNTESCGISSTVSDKSDIKLLMNSSVFFLTKQAGDYGVLVMISGFGNCMTPKMYSFNNFNGTFDYIDVYHLNNTEGTQCENNILVFPSLQKYYETIDMLDNLIEQDCDTFDATVSSNITDDQYDAMAEAAGFDEDNVLKVFEDNLGFCSLRRKLKSLESNWLSVQGDGDWDTDADPDNHFIDDDTERTLLSEGAEVMIGDPERGIIIYKFMEDGSVIEIINLDFEALEEINNGNIPVGNSNITILANPVDDPGSCKHSNDIRKYFNLSSKTRMKTVDKYIHATLLGNAKVKAKTKYYRKKLGIWMPGRTTLTARLESRVPLTCNALGDPPNATWQEKKRHKVKTKWHSAIDFVDTPEIGNDGTFGVHKVREALIKAIDLYDGDVH